MQHVRPGAGPSARRGWVGGGKRFWHRAPQQFDPRRDEFAAPARQGRGPLPQPKLSATRGTLAVVSTCNESPLHRPSPNRNARSHALQQRGDSYPGTSPALPPYPSWLHPVGTANPLKRQSPADAGRVARTMAQREADWPGAEARRGAHSLRRCSLIHTAQCQTTDCWRASSTTCIGRLRASQARRAERCAQRPSPRAPKEIHGPLEPSNPPCFESIAACAVGSGTRARCLGFAPSFHMSTLSHSGGDSEVPCLGLTA